MGDVVGSGVGAATTNTPVTFTLIDSSACTSVMQATSSKVVNTSSLRASSTYVASSSSDVFYYSNVIVITYFMVAILPTAPLHGQVTVVRVTVNALHIGAGQGALEVRHCLFLIDGP